MSFQNLLVEDHFRPRKQIAQVSDLLLIWHIMIIILHPHSLLFFRYTLAFVLTPLLRKDIDKFVTDWNGHSIRRGRTAECPAGVPDEIYDMPEEFGNTVKLFKQTLL